jgi:hypothetical protein
MECASHACALLWICGLHRSWAYPGGIDQWYPHKGLGEINPDQRRETPLNPTNRVLLQVTLMGDLVLPRRKDSRVDGELGWVGAQHAASLTVYDETKPVQQTEINLYT